MTQIKHTVIEELSQKYDLFLIDLWGVITEGEDNYPGVIDCVNYFIENKKVVFVTNAPRPNFIMKEKLKGWGIKNLDENMIVTSGDISRRIINKKFFDKLPKIFHLGEDKNQDLLRKFDYIKMDNIEEVDILLCSISRDEGDNLEEFNDILKIAAERKDIISICANPDIIIPKWDKIGYCSGYFARKIEDFGGDVIYAGKPKKIIYEYAMSLHKDIPPEKILMIGDSFETDILGANNVGIDSSLVLTGNARQHHQNYKNIGDKEKALQDKAHDLSIFPNYITTLRLK